MIRADGSFKARLMIVGEAPGESELEEGRPFVGASGRILWSALERYCGIKRHETFVTNVVQDAPALKSGKPSAAQVRAHWERLDRELAASSAEVLLLIGGISLSRITGLTKGITSMRGYVLQPEDCRPVLQRRRIQIGTYATSRKGMYQKGDPKFALRRVACPPILPPNVRYIIPCLHPSGIMRGGFAQLPALWADIQRAGRALNDNLKLIDRVPYSTDPPIFIPGQTVSWDIETDGETIIRFGCATADLTNTCLIDYEVVDYVRKTLLDRTSTVICHNAGFDIPRLCALVGLTIDQVVCDLEDTMLEAQLICPDLPKGLEKVAPLYLDITPWKDSSQDEPEAYNAKDAVAALEIRNEMAGELAGQVGEYIAIIDCMRALWKATARGIRIDPERVTDWRKDLTAEVGRLLATWPHPHVSLASNPQLAKFLYLDMKLPRQYNKDGGWTVERDAIEELKFAVPEHTPLLQHILDYRIAAHELKNWGEKLREDRVYPQYLPAGKEETEDEGGQGAGTGRIQARNPPIMGLPARRRDIVIADPGKKLWYTDLNQAEAWIEAVLFEDEILQAALREDLHAFISEKRGIDRIRAKNFWYGSGRGAGPGKLKKVMVGRGYHDITTAECRDFQNELMSMFPKWAAGRRRVAAIAAAQRFLDNPFGRRRRFYMPNGPGLPESVGWLIQSTVASAFIRMLGQVDKHVEILAPYHDAVLFQTDDDEKAMAVKAVMEQEWPQIAPDFRFGATAACGTRWSELEDVK